MSLSSYCFCGCKGKYFFLSAQLFPLFFLKKAQSNIIHLLCYDKSVYLCVINITLFLMEQVEQLVRTITKGIQEKKGSDITIADLSGVEGSICRYFVICQGNSPAQVEAITDSVEEVARVEAGEKPLHVVGLTNAQWVAMDYVDVMVHIFLPEVRDFYNLESLWEDAKFTQVANVD